MPGRCPREAAVIGPYWLSLTGERWSYGRGKGTNFLQKPLQNRMSEILTTPMRAQQLGETRRFADASKRDVSARRCEDG